MTNQLNEEDTDVDVFEQPESVKVQVADPSQAWVSLPASTMLTVEEADQLLCWRDASIITIVGERNGGKTTLVTEIYGRFLHGAFANTYFCHSLTLMGFERKSFHSRAESGRSYPDTDRTSAQDGLRFFHLALSDETDLLRHDLLISERAGEVYREIRDRPDRAVDMIEICKAATIAFIVDGERVAAPRKRAEVFASVRNIVRVVANSGNIAAHAQIQLVVTKFDLLDGVDKTEARDALATFEQSIESMLSGKFNIEVFHTAARALHPHSEPAQGLALLLRTWLKAKPPEDIRNLSIPELTDEFDKLLLRRIVQ
ncbi:MULTISPECIES: TRAFAC clade GTPase domain-containing protein [Yersinia]|uniref:Double-GTPase 2 domain-containing protein n=1 Tax=Yersinia pekkanenii TaxID=1288385 RepID=A0A0T9R3U1_9GAMM|nr:MULTISPECIES: hypothetical protein [Yersinia]ELW8204825.1 hypothetical protein [Yersinia enterocolitica]CNI41848.1 Uncharacterised protein [Yersinia pekkanenii]CRY65795.1 Uncharacterised protein [Yersinia pekkanenii]